MGERNSRVLGSSRTVVFSVSKAPGHRRGEVRLVAAIGSCEADGERSQAPGLLSRGHHRDRGRIEPTRQEHSQWRVRDELPPYGEVECGLELLGQRSGFLSQVAREHRTQLIVARLPEAEAGEVDLENRARVELANVAERGRRGRYVTNAEVGADEPGVGAGCTEAIVREGADLRREGELLRPGAQVERLHTEVIADQEELPARPIDQRKREHPLETLDQPLHPELLVPVSEHLGVGVAPEHVAVCGEPAAKVAGNCRARR